MELLEFGGFSSFWGLSAKKGSKKALFGGGF